MYIGNLSFHTSEFQLQGLFSRVGPVKSVIMGLNSKTKTPCGFGFVEFFEAADALESVAVLSGTVLDNRQIRVELDFGYKNGRHFGRGQTGGQVRDDRREGFDPGRTWASKDRGGGGGGGGGVGSGDSAAGGVSEGLGEAATVESGDDEPRGRRGGRGRGSDEEDEDEGGRRRRRPSVGSDEDDDDRSPKR